jgi:triosephosphate isomerase
MYGRSAGTAVRVLYGGSVEAKNAGALVRDGAVDGFLVGHASVDAKEFKAIIASADAA